MNAIISDFARHYGCQTAHETEGTCLNPMLFIFEELILRLQLGTLQEALQRYRRKVAVKSLSVPVLGAYQMVKRTNSQTVKIKKELSSAYQKKKEKKKENENNFFQCKWHPLNEKKNRFGLVVYFGNFLSSRSCYKIAF